MYKRECSLFMRIQFRAIRIQSVVSRELEYSLMVVIRIRKRKGFLALIHGFGFHAFIILL
jgi:hypothetical protein